MHPSSPFTSDTVKSLNLGEKQFASLVQLSAVGDSFGGPAGFTQV